MLVDRQKTYKLFIQPLVPRFDDFGPLSRFLGVHRNDIGSINAREEVVAGSYALRKLMVVSVIVPMGFVSAPAVVAVVVCHACVRRAVSMLSDSELLAQGKRWASVASMTPFNKHAQAHVSATCTQRKLSSAPLCGHSSTRSLHSQSTLGPRH